jgi:hypothetical protein
VIDDEVAVALWALVYRVAYFRHYTCAEDALTDLECCPGEVSLATLIASERLREEDWELIRRLDGPRSYLPLAREIVTDDPFRAEVLLHACPPNGRKSDRGWAAHLVRRWDRVSGARAHLQAEGLLATRDAVENVALAVYQMLTGGTHADYMDEYEDTLFAEDVSPAYIEEHITAA